MNSFNSTSKTILSLLIFLSTAIIFNACVKDQFFFDRPVIAVEEQEGLSSLIPDKLVTTNVFGSVVDEIVR